MKRPGLFKGRKVLMSEQTPGSGPAPRCLPDKADLRWLRKHAKHRLQELRRANPDTRLTEAQLELAREYGFSSWRALKAHIDQLTIDGQIIEAARKGDVAELTGLLDQCPNQLHLRMPPYDWTLLHIAAHNGHLPCVDLLLKLGLDVNTREKGDNTYAMHWAAAAGHVDVVRRLADAGGDVVGQGDDHQLEVIGWACCWDDADHRPVVDFLVSRGARHHIFSALAMNLAAEVRRIVAANPLALSHRLSRNENHQTPLHFAVRMNRPDMVALLLDLGADPLAGDGDGFPAAWYATRPDIDRPLMERTRTLLVTELDSALRGHRKPRISLIDLVAVLSLADWHTTALLLRNDPQLIMSGGPSAGALHLLAKRGDVLSVRWLLGHGADPNSRWSHWDAEVTPLHLAALGGHAAIVVVLLEAGADPQIRDSKHNGDALGWAEFFRRREIVQILREFQLPGGHPPG
jgi:ankyrin repeat protein